MEGEVYCSASDKMTTTIYINTKPSTRQLLIFFGSCSSLDGNILPTRKGWPAMDRIVGKACTLSPTKTCRLTMDVPCVPLPPIPLRRLLLAPIHTRPLRRHHTPSHPPAHGENLRNNHN